MTRIDTLSAVLDCDDMLACLLSSTDFPFLVRCVSWRWNDIALRIWGSAPPRTPYSNGMHTPQQLRWAVSVGMPRTPAVGLALVRRGVLTTVRWAAHNDFTWGVSSCAEAAKRGDLAVLSYLRRVGCPWTSSSSANAAVLGRLEVLRWACDRGCPMDTSTTAAAAYRADRDTFRWLVDRGCPANEDAYASALLNHALPHEEVLSFSKWLKNEMGCQWGDAATCAAGASGNVLVLQWLVSSGCPWSHFAVELAATHGHRSVLEWFERQGVWLGSRATVGAARRRRAHDAVARRGARLQWPRSACTIAARNGHRSFWNGLTTTAGTGTRPPATRRYGAATRPLWSGCWRTGARATTGRCGPPRNGGRRRW